MELFFAVSLVLLRRTTNRNLGEGIEGPANVSAWVNVGDAFSLDRVVVGYWSVTHKFGVCFHQKTRADEELVSDPWQLLAMRRSQTSLHGCV